MSFSISEFNEVVEKCDELLGEEYDSLKMGGFTAEFNEGKVGEDPEYMTLEYTLGMDLFRFKNRQMSGSDTEQKFESASEVYEHLKEEF